MTATSPVLLSITSSFVACEFAEGGAGVERDECTGRVDSDTVEIRLAGRLIATDRLVAGWRVDVWDPTHKLDAETLALGWDPTGPDLRM